MGTIRRRRPSATVRIPPQEQKGEGEESADTSTTSTRVVKQPSTGPSFSPEKNKTKKNEWNFNYYIPQRTILEAVPIPSILSWVNLSALYSFLPLFHNNMNHQDPEEEEEDGAMATRLLMTPPQAQPQQTDLHQQPHQQQPTLLVRMSNLLIRILQFLVCHLPRLLWTGVRLACFVAVLLVPGFLRFAHYYITTKDRMCVKYAFASCRQTLDIYGATSSSTADGNSTEQQQPQSQQQTTKKPVLVFVPGGAWLIGYKMWAALTARALVPFGILVVIPDYRNYPVGTVVEMEHDVRTAIQWAFNHCESYGGDRTKVVVCGQSAGGHLASNAMLQSVCLEASSSETETTEATPSLLPPICGFVSLSAPHDLQLMAASFQRHGLGPHLLSKIFATTTENNHYDNDYLLHQMIASAQQHQHQHEQLRLLPAKMAIVHGSCDKTVPLEGSRAYYESLRRIMTDTSENNVSFQVYDGWSHTDAILEALLDGDHRFHADLCEWMESWTGCEIGFDPALHPEACGRLAPHWAVCLARWLNPF